MLAMLQIYIPLLLFATMIDETWNCSNPRPYVRGVYNVCQWEESDMKKINGRWLLRTRDMHDNFFERRARKRYWKKRGYDSKEIMLK